LAGVMAGFFLSFRPAIRREDYTFEFLVQQRRITIRARTQLPVTTATTALAEHDCHPLFVDFSSGVRFRCSRVLRPKELAFGIAGRSVRPHFYDLVERG
jgi:hypothetical protein